MRGSGPVDLVAVGRDVLARATRYPGDLEVFVEHSETISVKVYQGEVESLVTGAPMGLGVRYVEGSRSGYAYTGDFSGAALDRVVAMAVSNTSVSDADVFVRLPDAPQSYPEVPGLWRPGLLETPMNRRSNSPWRPSASPCRRPTLRRWRSPATSTRPRAWPSSRRAGWRYTASRPSATSTCPLTPRSGDEVQTGLGFDTGREPGELDATAAGHEAAGKAAALLGARPCPTGRYTVVLDREAAAAVIGVAARALSADAVQRGRSLFAGRLGEHIAADSFTLVDHGLHADGMSTAPFDDEGVPRGVTPLVENGTLKGFLHDTYTAAREGAGARSTGNARRGGYRVSPGVAPSNLILTQGEGTLDELLARAGEACTSSASPACTPGPTR